VVPGRPGDDEGALAAEKLCEQIGLSSEWKKRIPMRQASATSAS
jgi:hypothetical protein